MYEERERERGKEGERTKRQRGGGGENRGGRDGSKVEVKKRSERKGVVGKIHLFEKRYRVTSNARPSLPFHIFLSFASHFLLSICACVPFPLRSTSPSPSRFFYSLRPSPPELRGEHEPRTSRAVAQNLAGEFFPWKWLIERAPVQTRGYRGLFPLFFCEPAAARPPSRFANAPPRRTSLSYRSASCIRN